MTIPGFLTPLFPQYLYLVFFLFALLYRFMPPMTEEAMLTIIGVVGATWRAPFILVLAVVYLGVCIIDSILFSIAKVFGKRLFKFRVVTHLIKPEQLDATKRYFNQKGIKVVFITRFVYGVRDYIKLAAGMVGMGYRKFIAVNSIAGAFMILVWITVGYVSGSMFLGNYSSDASFIGNFQNQLGIGLPIFAISSTIIIGLWLRSDMKKNVQGNDVTDKS